MRQRIVSLAACLLGAPLAGCLTPAPQPLTEQVVVRVVAVDSARQVRFALDVSGGQAELRTQEMYGWATDARLIAVTPAEVILRPGTTAAAFSVLGGGQLAVSAVAPGARLWADGSRVGIVSTAAGISILTEFTMR